MARLKTQPSPGKGGKGALTLERILAAAAESFGRDGYQNSKMNRVAAMAGVSRAALYKYFPTKESLLLALHEKIIADTLAHAKAILASDAPALHVIGDWLRYNLLDERVRASVRILTLEDVQALLTLDHEATAQALKTMKLALMRVLRRGVQEGDLDPALNPADTAHMLQALAFSVNRNNMSDRPVVALAESRHVDAFLAALADGLRRRR